jgi:hypothetical protein
LREMADALLLAALSTLARRSDEIASDLLAHLAEVDERRLHVELGFSSLFAYCTERLGMSESVAGRRITAARVCRKFPQVFARVAQGALNLTTLCALNPHLSTKNAEELFEACANRSRLQVEEILAARFPKADLRERVRVEALSPDRYGVQFTADSEFRELLAQARALASHQLPGGNMNDVLKLALKAFVQKAEKRRFSIGRRPRGVKSVGGTRPARSHSPGEYTPKARQSRHVPAAVAREVYVRDDGRCTFTARDGRRCGGRMFLELDHIVPFANGGAATAANLRLRCRAHNQWHARRLFGRRYIQAAIARGLGKTAKFNESREATGREAARSA